MSPAKVRLQGTILFVPKGKDIRDFLSYESLPIEDKRYLSGHTIQGERNGFTLTSDFQENILLTRYRYNSNIDLPGYGAKWVRENGKSVLVLPGGTRIEPLTTRQMENEIRALQKPSRREK